jgi:chemotaxis protein CheD
MDRCTVFVQAGDVAVSREPCDFTTVLGSCVSVCLYDLVNCWGGMNHFMHVGRNNTDPNDARWSRPAIHLLLEKMLRLGASPHDLKAKIFGGANVLSCIKAKIGENNYSAAYVELEAYGIPIIAGSVGGSLSRRVAFRSDTGEVQILSARGKRQIAVRLLAEAKETGNGNAQPWDRDGLHVA